MNKVSVLFSIILIVLGISITLAANVQYFNRDSYEGTITDKYNKRDGKSDSFYIVLDDKRVIENRDALFIGKFDSADIQARIKIGTKVKIKTMGFRNNFFNMYPNLIEIERVSQ